MDLTSEFVEQTMAAFFKRCELVKLAGGVALRDVVDQTATVPPGWHLDFATQYYIPPGLILDAAVQ